MKIIDISQSKHLYFSHKSIREYRVEENKGWSFSNVYSFEELRDVYIILLKQNSIGSVEKFTNEEVIPKVKPKGKEWSSRRVREVLNALINFHWFTRDISGTIYSLATTEPLFDENSFGKAITDKEKNVFEKTFFSYERFREYLTLYSQQDVSKVVEFSTPVFSFSTKGKYTDTFFKSLNDNVDLICVESNEIQGEKDSSFLMFWDVFVSWALNLNIMEKFNSLLFDMKLSTGKTFACSFFISPQHDKIPNLPQVLKLFYSEKKIIDVNELILNICLNYRKPITEVKEYIVQQYTLHKQSMGIVRTSEIFINKSDKRKEEDVAYPKYKDSYFSHIILN